jgi:hypothetical protein
MEFFNKNFTYLFKFSKKLFFLENYNIKPGLKHIHMFYYNMGDLFTLCNCIFIELFKTSIQLQQDNMVYLHDLNHGQTNNEQMYLHKMPMPIANSGL